MCWAVQKDRRLLFYLLFAFCKQSGAKLLPMHFIFGIDA